MSVKPVLKSEWLCIACGDVLGRVSGGELHPAVNGEFIRTSGPNLAVVCPHCRAVKTWYTSDPVVRAVYQLTDAVATVAARSMVQQVSQNLNKDR